MNRSFVSVDVRCRYDELILLEWWIEECECRKEFEGEGFLLRGVRRGCEYVSG